MGWVLGASALTIIVGFILLAWGDRDEWDEQQQAKLKGHNQEREE